MTERMKLDRQDLAVLRALDSDFEISPDGEVATVSGEMELMVMRVTDDLFELKFKLPSGSPLDIKVFRAGLMDQFDVKDDS